MIHKELGSLVSTHMSSQNSEEWDLNTLTAELQAIFPLPPGPGAATPWQGCTLSEVEARLLEHADALYREREEELGSEDMRTLERRLMLGIIDPRWLGHMTEIEDLRQSIGLQAFGQRDPLVMYKLKGRESFERLLGSIQRGIVQTIYHVGLESRPAVRRVQRPQVPAVARQSAAATGARKVGRNDPCPCGSGKKYKRCHGVAA